ncbi:hypothetical protein QBC32DRAFT_367193 [Pseudoneurospora amorphoporcata]|uniref:Uncharacterized protein n=1 Tax=Pseudoneurospora amorphoporcata TaxID=241081 RepID=A0AAN6P1N4_9PEZI|nr:hypothetical protein QBC32DRAFT_367193 [Pseudoneurospora amorphoporcata]
MGKIWSLDGVSSRFRRRFCWFGGGFDGQCTVLADWLGSVLAKPEWRGEGLNGVVLGEVLLVALALLAFQGGNVSVPTARAVHGLRVHSHQSPLPGREAKLPTWRPRQCQPAPIRAISSCKVRIGVQSYRQPSGFWWNDDASKHSLVVMGSSN